MVSALKKQYLHTKAKCIKDFRCHKVGDIVEISALAYGNGYFVNKRITGLKRFNRHFNVEDAECSSK